MVHPDICRVLPIPGGAGIRPSTVFGLVDRWFGSLVVWVGAPSPFRFTRNWVSNPQTSNPNSKPSIQGYRIRGLQKIILHNPVASFLKKELKLWASHCSLLPSKKRNLKTYLVLKESPFRKAALSLFVCVPSANVATNFNMGPFGGHHFGGDSCPPVTFEVVPS